MIRAMVRNQIMCQFVAQDNKPVYRRLSTFTVRYFLQMEPLEKGIIAEYTSVAVKGNCPPIIFVEYAQVFQAEIEYLRTTLKHVCKGCHSIFVKLEEGVRIRVRF